MSKYIKQDDIFELVRTGVLVSNSNFESVCKHIGSLPAIDIVHCKDCKHLNKSQVINGTERRYKCDCIDEYMLERNFCSFGERIGNE